MNQLTLSNKLHVQFRTTGNHAHFFGYYDKFPLSADGTRLLAHRVPFDGRDILPGDRAEIGYWDTRSSRFHRLETTTAFNWQQGAMLQWLPPDFARKFIFNQAAEQGFKSVIVDIESGTKKNLNFPVYAVHPSGEFALGANFEHLYFCRPGYNYFGEVDPRWKAFIPDGDGIFKVHLSSGFVEQVVSTRQLAGVLQREDFPIGYHWLEHMQWNPSGTRFAFFHRWESDRNNGHYNTRLYTVSANGEDLFLYPDTGFYSHMDWRNDRELTIWARIPSFRTRMTKRITRSTFFERYIKKIYQKTNAFLRSFGEHPLLHHQAYVNFHDQGSRFEVIPHRLLKENGHGTWSADERWFLADTYHNANNYRKLLVYDSEDGTTEELGSFFSPYNDCGYRCDLHPRFDMEKKLIVIDSAHENGIRQMYILKAEDWL